MLATVAHIVPASWSLADILIAIVVIAAGVALVYVALRAFGLTFPEWAKQIVVIVVVAVLVIVAIRFVVSV